MQMESENFPDFMALPQISQNLFARCARRLLQCTSAKQDLANF